MRLHITSVEKRHSDKAGDYIQIKGTTPEGEDKTFNLFKQLQPAWYLCKEGADLDLKTVWRGANENVQNIKIADEEWPEDTSEVAPEEVAEKPKPAPLSPKQEAEIDKALKPPPNPQAVGMCTKEIGDMIRAKYLGAIFGEEARIELTKWYRGQVLDITRIPFDETKLPTFEA